MQPHDPFGQQPGGDDASRSEGRPPQQQGWQPGQGDPAAPYQQPGQPGQPGQGWPPPGQSYPQQPYPQQSYPQQQYPPQADHGQQAFAAQTSGWGQHGGYQGYPGQQPYPGGQPPAPAKGRSRKGLWFAIVGIVVVAGLVVGGVFLFTGSDDSDSASPGDVVTTYLDSLAKGDAAAALATGVQPPSTILLTDAVLAQQQKLATISDVKIVRSEQRDGQAVVEATYSFGDQHADETFPLVKRSGAWSLSATTVSLSTSTFDTLPQPKLFGVDISRESKLYVFPGPLQFSSGNGDFAITQRASSDGDAFQLAPSSYGYVSLQAALSPAGKQKAQQALQSAMAACAKTKATYAENCPNSVSSSDTGSGKYPIDGTATWTPPTDYSDIEYTVGYDKATDVRVSGSLSFGVKVTVRQYKGSKVVTSPVSTTVEEDVYGTVDLAKSPPTFER